MLHLTSEFTDAAVRPVEEDIRGICTISRQTEVGTAGKSCHLRQTYEWRFSESR